MVSLLLMSLHRFLLQLKTHHELFIPRASEQEDEPEDASMNTFAAGSA